MNFKKLGVLATAALGTVSSFAAAVDVTSVVTDITANLAPIASIGAAVLGVAVALKAYKWIRRAL